MVYTVKQVAKITGVSVRTLHYYDQIGLLKPSFVKENGYRCYGENELMKLEQILFFKELEFSLNDIVKIVTAPDFDTLGALVEQKKFLELKKAKIASMVYTIDKTINNLKGGGKSMNNDSADTTQAQIDEYKEEARKRWGNTDAYKQSLERTKHWTKEDYKKVTEDWKKFNQVLANTMDKGFDSEEFQALIAKQYESVNTFYDCSIEMFRELGNMYAIDPKFRKTYESFRPGLADFMQKAINYYCDKHKS